MNNNLSGCLRELKNKGKVQLGNTYLVRTLKPEVFLADISIINVSCRNKFNALLAKF